MAIRRQPEDRQWASQHSQTSPPLRRLFLWKPLCDSCRVFIVEVLLDAGADINAVETGLACKATSIAQNAQSLTPLRQAVIVGDVAMARFLVRRGADIYRSGMAQERRLMRLET